MTDPLILAFDTSAAHCAAALLSGDTVLASRVEDMQKGQAERLFPMLEEILAEGGASWRDLSAIGVGIGPGNFTSVRIAVAAARGLALSLGRPAYGVSSFENMLGPDHPDATVLVSLPAPRDMAYVQVFRAGKPLNPPDVIDPISPPPGQDATAVIGHRADEIARHLGVPATLTAMSDPAITIARIVANRLRDGAPIAPPAPLYVRPADACPPSDPPPVILP